MKIEPRTFTLPNGKVLTVRSLCADDAEALNAFRYATYSETYFMARYPEEGANLETVFPGYPDRVFAHWYTGTLRVPQGKVLKYVHMGYQSTFESDMLIDVERGVVGEVRIRENEVPKKKENSRQWD